MSVASKNLVNAGVRISRAEKEIVATPAQDRRESILRLAVYQFVALVLIFGFVGTGWDIEWHLQIGRDSTFTPPHLAIYTGMGLTGITALLVVLFQTYRYWLGSASVTRRTVSSFFNLFYAPLGIFGIGFAMLGGAVAAPLDDYWHQLYGIDVSIWTPFHMMGLISSCLAQACLMLAFASEYNRNQARWEQSGTPADRRLTWWALVGLTLVAATLLAKLILAVIPATIGISLTPLQIPLYALLLAILQPLVLVAPLVATRRLGTATLSGLFFGLIQLLINAAVPALVSWQMAAEGLQLRANNPATLMDLHTLATALPGWLPVAGLAVDLLFFVRLRLTRKNWGFLALLPSELLQPKFVILAGAVAGLILAALNRPYEIVHSRALEVAAQFTARAETYPDWLPRLLEFNPNFLAALPLALLLGALSAWLGYYFGLVMRYTNR